MLDKIVFFQICFVPFAPWDDERWCNTCISLALSACVTFVSSVSVVICQHSVQTCAGVRVLWSCTQEHCQCEFYLKVMVRERVYVWHHGSILLYVSVLHHFQPTEKMQQKLTFFKKTDLRFFHWFTFNSCKSVFIHTCCIYCIFYAVFLALRRWWLPMNFLFKALISQLFFSALVTQIDEDTDGCYTKLNCLTNERSCDSEVHKLLQSFLSSCGSHNIAAAVEVSLFSVVVPELGDCLHCKLWGKQSCAQQQLVSTLSIPPCLTVGNHYEPSEDVY